MKEADLFCVRQLTQRLSTGFLLYFLIAALLAALRLSAGLSLLSSAYEAFKDSADSAAASLH